MKIATPKNFWIDEFVALRSKTYSFKCNDKKVKNLKGISKYQSQNTNSEEYYNCLFAGQYQKECDKFLIRSLNHEIYLQKVIENTLSPFDNKRC